VGQFAEYSKKHRATFGAEQRRRQDGFRTQETHGETELNVTLPAVVNVRYCQ